MRDDKAQEIALLKQLLDANDNIVYAFDLDGYCLFANVSLAKLFGVAQETLPGSLRAEVMPEEIAQAHHTNDLKVAASGMSITLEEYNEEAAGMQVYESIKFPLFDASGTIYAVGGISRNVTDKRSTESSLSDTRKQLQALATQHLETLERERKDISRDLHDDIGQILTALRLALMKARRLADAGSALEMGNALNTALTITDTAIVRTQVVAQQLRPPQLDHLGLTASLRWFIDSLSQQASASLYFVEEIGNSRYSPDMELACFRVAQEALSNALRHAQARAITLRLARDAYGLVLAVTDDGGGFAYPADYQRSLGLLGMNERVENLGGILKIESVIGEGTRVEAHFPLPAEAM